MDTAVMEYAGQVVKELEIRPIKQGYDIEHDGVTISKEIVTPERALQWLTNMSINRTLRQNQVDKIKEDILNGDWEFDGQPFRFSNEGKMLDGQHRAHAIIKAGKSVPSII